MRAKEVESEPTVILIRNALQATGARIQLLCQTLELAPHATEITRYPEQQRCDRDVASVV